MNTAGQLASGGTSISDGIFDYLCPGPFRTLSVSLWGGLYSFYIILVIDCL